MSKKPTTTGQPKKPVNCAVNCAVEPLPIDLSLENLVARCTAMGFNVSVMAWPARRFEQAHFSVRVENYRDGYFGDGLEVALHDWSMYVDSPPHFRGIIESVITQFNEWLDQRNKPRPPEAFALSYS